MNKDIYALKKNKCSFSEYYTKIRYFGIVGYYE